MESEDIPDRETLVLFDDMFLEKFNQFKLFIIKNN